MVKNPPAHAGDLGLIFRSARSPRVGNGKPLQSPCLENSMDRGAWQATVMGSQKSDTEPLSTTTIFLESNLDSLESVCMAASA